MGRNGFKPLKRVLITGAARGIGKALAREFTSKGWQAVLTDIDRDLLDATRRELADDGATVWAFPLDVTDTGSILAARSAIDDEVGKITALVNNAGTVHGGEFLDVPLERHIQTYRLNVEGVVAVTHAFMPQILDAPQGHLVFMASASGFIGLPNGATYASSKWAVIGFAESIRAELREQGVTRTHVTTVCPSYVDTGLFEGAAAPTATRMLRPEELAEQVVEAVEKGQVWLLTPSLVKLTPLIRNALPTALADRISEILGVDKSMSDWSGHGGEDASVSDPRPKTD